MIDIIIPAYNSHDTISQTLLSIAYQELIDKCNVIIVNDGSKNSYDDIVKYYNIFMNIEEIKIKENKGPGYARQYGINHSNGEYIIFIDSDDVFSSPDSISVLYNVIESNNYDVVTSDFYEETDDELILKQNDMVWLHGKIYRRKFLIDNNIEFNNSRQNEDNSFNQLIRLTDANIGYISRATYIWRNNKQSVTRNNNYNFKYDGIINYIDNILWVLEIGNNRNYDKYKINLLAFSSLVYLYNIYLEFYKEKNIDNLIINSKKIKKYYNENNLTKEDKEYILNEQYNDYYNEYTRDYLLNPIITFDQFLDLLEGEKND